jgi:hypothetical protein
MYHYEAYHCRIDSELEFPELIETGSAEGCSSPDIHICTGVVPDALENPTGKGVLYQASANQFLLNMDGVARYLVQNGNEIIVQPAPESLAGDVRVFLLGSCIGALLHQRGVLVLHAGAVYTDRGAVLFTGPSGVGKSTLLGEFLRRGYRMMVDDVCAVVVDAAGTPLVLPGYPRTRLWTDAAHRLEQDITGLERTRPGMEKYERQVPAQFWDQPATLHHIYLLTSSNRDELKLEAEPRIRTFSIVLHNTYRRQFLDGLEMRAPHFGLVSAVAKASGVTRVVRPSYPFRLVELADLIEQDLAQG